MACDHPNKYLSFKMVGVVHYCPDCKKTLIMDYVTVPREEYEELEKKAHRYDTIDRFYKKYPEGRIRISDDGVIMEEYE